MADDAPHRSDESEDDLDAIEKAAQDAADRLLGADAEVGTVASQAASAAEHDEAFDERLRELESRAEKHRIVREAARAKTQRQQSKDADSARGLGVGMTIAYAILGMPLVGAGLGWLLDERLGVKIWMGIGMLLGAVAGIGFAVLTINRVNRDS